MSQSRIACVCALSAFVFGAAASASDIVVVLEINATDPSAVVFTATGAASNAIDNSVSTNSGVTLLDLFASDIDLGFVTPASAGDLTASGATAPFNRIVNGFSTVGLRDLNMWNAGSSSDMDFNFTDAAFTGSWTIDLSGATFGGPGRFGFIVSDDDPANTGEIIGEWRLVPAPGGVAVLGIGGIVGLRRRR